MGFVDHARFGALRVWRTHGIPAGWFEVAGVQVDDLGVLAVARQAQGVGIADERRLDPAAAWLVGGDFVLVVLTIQ